MAHVIAVKPSPVYDVSSNSTETCIHMRWKHSRPDDGWGSKVYRVVLTPQWTSESNIMVSRLYKCVKYKRTDALSLWHQQESTTVDINGTLQTRGETRCPVGVSVSWLKDDILIFWVQKFYKDVCAKIGTPLLNLNWINNMNGTRVLDIGY